MTAKLKIRQPDKFPYPFGIGFDHCGPVGTITIARGMHSDNNVFATGMVPSRPTGAHRQSDNDGWVNPNAVLLIKDPKYGPFGRSFECPRVWHEGFAVEFEYIPIPSDF